MKTIIINETIDMSCEIDKNVDPQIIADMKEKIKTFNYTVKAKLTFDDGINKGTFKVKAVSDHNAYKLALEMLSKNWPGAITIEILSVARA